MGRRKFVESHSLGTDAQRMRLRGGRRLWQPSDINQDAALSGERDSHELEIPVEAGLARSAGNFR